MRYARRPGFSLGAYVARHFPRAAASGSERVVDCPACGRPKCYVNAQKAVWYCMRCAATGTAAAFVREHRRVSDAEAARIVAGGDYAAAAERVDRERVLALAASPQVHGPSGDCVVAPTSVLPKEYRALPCDASSTGRGAYIYLRERGLTQEQIVSHRIGFCAAGRFAGRVIVPVIAGGALVYFVARAIRASVARRYLNPKSGETPRGASEVLFNLDVAALYGRAVIVEGVFDALAVGPTGVAALGKRLSRAQVALVAAAGLRSATVMLDGDGSVPLAESLALARQLRDAGVPAVDVARPVGDPGDRRGERDRRPYAFGALVAARVGLAS